MSLNSFGCVDRQPRLLLDSQHGPVQVFIGSNATPSASRSIL